MRKNLAFLCSLLFSVLFFYQTVTAASVTPQTFPGNDSNPADYSPPIGYFHYKIPMSNTTGSHTVTFFDTNAVNPATDYSFTVTIGTVTGKNYTQVLSWSSNFPIYAVIVTGRDAFNLYQYDNGVRSDTNLVTPNAPNSDPTDVLHVSVVIDNTAITPVTPVIAAYSDGPSFLLLFVVITVFIILIIVFFLLGLLLGKTFEFFCHHHSKNTDQVNLYIDNKDTLNVDNDNMNINQNINKNQIDIDNKVIVKECKDCKDTPINPCEDNTFKNSPPKYSSKDFYHN